MRLLLLLLHAANASLSQYFRRHKVKDAIPAAIASTIAVSYTHLTLPTILLV